MKYAIRSNEFNGEIFRFQTVKSFVLLIFVHEHNPTMNIELHSTFSLFNYLSFILFVLRRKCRT